jgi:hypothetical protein
MAKKKKGGGKLSRFRRRLIATLLVLAILYIGAHVISRTEGIRALTADKISNGTGLPVSLKKCGATPLMGFRLKGLLIQGAEMPDVKMSFNWFSFLSKEQPFVKKIRLKDAEIRFRRVPATGNWEPLILHGIAARLGAVVGVNPVQEGADESLPTFPSYAISGRTLLELEDVKLMWLDEKGNELASIEEADFSTLTKRFRKRKVTQAIVDCDQITLSSRRVLDDFRLEVVHLAGSDWITVLEMSDRGGEYPQFSTPTLWQELNQQLNQLSAVE